MLRDTISDKIISYIDVSCPLDTLSSAIIFQFDGSLVILIDNSVMDIIFLLFQEVLGPYHLGQDISSPTRLASVEILVFSLFCMDWT